MGIMRTLKRDIGSQFAVSRNIKETRWNRVRRVFWASVYICKAFKIAIKAIRRECLGSHVIYKGKECWISNWSNTDHPTLAADGFYEQNCDRKEIRNVVNIREFYHRFDVALHCYMGSHYGTDIMRRLYPEYFPNQ